MTTLLSVWLIVNVATFITCIPVYSYPTQDHIVPTPSSFNLQQQKNIKLFGITVEPGKLHTAPVQFSSLPRSPAATEDSASTSYQIGSTSTNHKDQKTDHDDWPETSQYKEISRKDAYKAFFQRLGIMQNYSVKSKLLANLTSDERKFIENKDEAGIRTIILSRGHLIRYAPLEFPKDRRPGDVRKAKLKIKLAKMSAAALKRFSNEVTRERKEGWYSHHSMDEARAIREKVRKLHGLPKFESRLNRKIAKISVKERRLALENNKEALWKLSPMNYGRPTEHRERKLEAVLKAEDASTSNAALTSTSSRFEKQPNVI